MGGGRSSGWRGGGGGAGIELEKKKGGETLAGQETLKKKRVGFFWKKERP